MFRHKLKSQTRDYQRKATFAASCSLGFHCASCNIPKMPICQSLELKVFQDMPPDLYVQETLSYRQFNCISHKVTSTAANLRRQILHVAGITDSTYIPIIAPAGKKVYHKNLLKYNDPWPSLDTHIFLKSPHLNWNCIYF